jgi:hypothetical protein
VRQQVLLHKNKGQSNDDMGWNPLKLIQLHNLLPSITIGKIVGRKIPLRRQQSVLEYVNLGKLFWNIFVWKWRMKEGMIFGMWNQRN